MSAVVLSDVYHEKDFQEVNPEFGTLDSFKNMSQMLLDAGKTLVFIMRSFFLIVFLTAYLFVVGIKVIMDIDLTSTSKNHPWFTKNPDYYFTVKMEDGANNWVCHNIYPTHKVITLGESSPLEFAKIQYYYSC